MGESKDLNELDKGQTVTARVRVPTLSPVRPQNANNGHVSIRTGAQMN